MSGPVVVQPPPTDVRTAHENVCRLVDQFDAARDAYLSPGYQEAQARNDFIDKFFTALGWDVSHNIQTNPYLQEVQIERSVSSQEEARRARRKADYAFFLAPDFQQVRFFVEAKKPSEALRRPEHYYQTVRYGWNAGTPVAILTDFEELHILDCRSKPDLDQATAIHHLEDFRYTEYTDFDKFERLYYRFSREGLSSGSFDVWVQGLEKPRGKVYQLGLFAGGYRAMDEAFLDELDSVRLRLAGALFDANPAIDGETLTEVTQRVIDRLVLMRFLEDRQIEQSEIIDDLGSTTGRSWDDFLRECERLETKYNGMVFKHHPTLDRRDFRGPDEAAFVAIISELSHKNSPFDFNAIPIHILGSIYERFLGKVVVVYDGRLQIEEKPEVRKSGGVYYTPQRIVQYIVDSTIGPMVSGRSPEELKSLSVIDIACGSGSFLITAYDLILRHFSGWYNDHPDAAATSGCEFVEGKWKLSLKQKREILTRSIYGLDIDPQAVEVTYVSLYLRLLEEERHLGMFRERHLPDLSRNILAFNSLIEQDLLDTVTISDRDERVLRPMDIDALFPRVMNRGGFDAVVGNPPYVRQEMISKLKSYLRANYEVYHGSADLYAYFMERALSITRPGGSMAMIVSNKWMRANYAKSLRRWLKKFRIVELVDFGDLPVFEGVMTYPCILAVQRSTPGPLLRAAEVRTLAFGSLEEHLKGISFSVTHDALDDRGWTLGSGETASLITKLRASGVTLDSFVGGRFYYGVKTGCNEAFVIDDATKRRLVASDPTSAQIIKPFLLGRDIKRYATPVATRHVIFARRGVNIDAYPAIRKHLEQYREQLTPKPKGFNGSKWPGRKAGSYEWFELQDAVDYYQAFEEPKIIYPNICRRPEFTIDRCSAYANQKCFIIGSDDHFLLGVLNSSVSAYLFNALLPKLRGGYFEPGYVFLKDFPIPAIDGRAETRIQIASHAAELLSLYGSLVDLPTESARRYTEQKSHLLRRKIDRLVYELFDLTDEEVTTVEALVTDE